MPFLGAYIDSKLVGFVMATGSQQPTLTAESMKHHEPAGRTMCIHSVCVDKKHRRTGIATALVREYIRRLVVLGDYDSAVLIVHRELAPLYENCGFRVVGKSAVVHGTA